MSAEPSGPESGRPGSPRVSVVIPSYNNADFIEETVDSVLSQTFTDFELLIADHSSTDRTWELLQQYRSDPRVRLLVTEAGGGAERNWNRVTSEASAPLVKLVCGDDVIYPEMLARQVAALEAAGESAVMASTPRDLVDASGKVVIRNLGVRGLPPRMDGARAVRRLVLSGANIFGEPCCVMMRRSALEAVGWWHGDPGFLIDQSTYARVLLRGDLVTTPGPLAAFRISAGQWSVRLAKEQATSAASMHAQLAALAPGLLSRRELAIGDARAVVRAAQRRLVYLYLGRRLSPRRPDDPT